MASEQAVNEKQIAEFVTKLRDAAKDNLASVILFGSAVAGDFHPEYSNVNLLCVLRDGSYGALQAVAPAVKWWDSEKQPPPLFMTRGEVERSADVFTIEMLDMQQHHRVLFGEDLVQKLSIPPNLHRDQVEYELREKLALLRQHLLLALGNDARSWEVLLRSVSSFATLFRHVLIVRGDEAPAGKREAVQALAAKIGFDATGFSQVMDVRERKSNRKQFVVEHVFSRYLAAVEKVTGSIEKVPDASARSI